MVLKKLTETELLGLANKIAKDLTDITFEAGISSKDLMVALTMAQDQIFKSHFDGSLDIYKEAICEGVATLEAYTGDMKFVN